MTIKIANWHSLCGLILLGLMGCATPFTWVNPSNSQANYQVDLYHCGNLANRSVPLFDSSDYVPPPVVNVGPESNRACTNIGGSTVNCFSATPQPAIPLTDSQQFGEDDRQQFIDRCLERRGWIKQAITK